MHGNLPEPSRPAIFPTAKNVSKSPDTATKPVAKVGSDAKSGSEWFPDAARAILGDDAGLQLHYITGFPERSCYRWASGESAPPDNFIRALFHSPQGAPFFAAFMADCKAPWWREHQRSVELAALGQRFAAAIAKIK